MFYLGSFLAAAVQVSLGMKVHARDAFVQNNLFAPLRKSVILRACDFLSFSCFLRIQLLSAKLPHKIVILSEARHKRNQSQHGVARSRRTPGILINLCRSRLFRPEVQLCGATIFIGPRAQP
jgi:hypothetical protein